MSPFSIVPVELLQADLKPNEFRVLVALYSFRNKTTDTVWPGLDLLAERANIRDTTTVSKVTTSLQKKGYLSKKKKGFSGRNEYKLTFPELGETSKLEKSSNFDESTNSLLDKTSNSLLDKTSNCKEDTNEQTNEQTNITFDLFWDNYPRKDNKKKSQAAFNRLSREKKIKAINDCVVRYKSTEKKYIPLATTYINGERWDDELPELKNETHIKSSGKHNAIDYSTGVESDGRF